MGTGVATIQKGDPLSRTYNSYIELCGEVLSTLERQKSRSPYKLVSLLCQYIWSCSLCRIFMTHGGRLVGAGKTTQKSPRVDGQKIYASSLSHRISFISGDLFVSHNYMDIDIWNRMCMLDGKSV